MQIEAHGYRFNVEASGFVAANAEADRDAGIEAIEIALSKMAPERVAALHAADRAWQSADCDGERPDDMGRLERIGEKIATAEWHRPEAASITISAVE